MTERHWGHTVRWVEQPPKDPTHSVTATFPDGPHGGFPMGRSRDAQMIALQGRCANDPACTGEPSCFTTRKLADGLEVTLYWGGEDVEA